MNCLLLIHSGVFVLSWVLSKLILHGICVVTPFCHCLCLFFLPLVNYVAKQRILYFHSWNLLHFVLVLMFCDCCFCHCYNPLKLIIKKRVTCRDDDISRHQGHVHIYFDSFSIIKTYVDKSRILNKWNYWIWLFNEFWATRIFYVI